jgi:hypothetical protein
MALLLPGEHGNAIMFNRLFILHVLWAQFGGAGFFEELCVAIVSPAYY